MPVPREGSKAFKFGENATKSQDPSVYRGTRAVSLVTDTLQLGKPRQAIQGTVSLSASRGRPTLWHGPASAPSALSARQAAAGLRKCVWPRRPEHSWAEYDRSGRPRPSDVADPRFPDPAAAGRVCVCGTMSRCPCLNPSARWQLW